MIGLDKSESFEFLVERIINRLKGWKEKILSMGGREILLKVVIQSIPVFAMAVFKIPKKVCKDITDAMASFWWGDREEHSRMHWSACGGECAYPNAKVVWVFMSCMI